MRSIVLAAFLLGAGVLATGCTATVASDPYPPDLVYAAPGVQVVADYKHVDAGSPRVTKVTSDHQCRRILE